jgi:hypothetical protein
VAVPMPIAPATAAGLDHGQQRTAPFVTARTIRYNEQRHLAPGCEQERAQIRIEFRV